MSASYLMAATAAALIFPSATSFVVPVAVTSAASSSTSALGVSSPVEGSTRTKLLSPPKNVEDLANTSEDLYNENVQTTYG